MSLLAQKWRAYQELKKMAQSDSSEVASIAVRSGSHILMGKRRDNNRWTLPGGHLNTGESHHEGAVRELFEESGIKVQPHELTHLGSEDLTTYTGKKKRIHAFTYLHQGERPTVKNDPDKEVHQWEWIDCATGLPKVVEENLHSPKNLTLQKLGVMQKSLAGRSYNDLRKSETLDKSKPKDVFSAKDPLSRWVSGYESPETRDKIRPVTGAKREQMLSLIGSKTQSRKTKNGREFLLHRGMSPSEYSISEGGAFHDPNDFGRHLSWTTDHKVAKQFANMATEGEMGKGKVASAWVHEDRIVHHPVMHYPDNTEHEVIVRNSHAGIKKSVTPGQSYNDLKKTEELRKMPVLTDEPPFAKDPVNSPHWPKDTVQTKKVGKNLWHHYSAAPSGMHEGKTLHFHSLSESKIPQDKPLSVLSGSTTKGSKTFKVDTAHTAQDRRGEGHGTHIYKLAAKHHGSLESDTTLSSDAHDVYKRVAKDPKYKVKFGTTESDTEDEDENSHHVKYVGKSELQKSKWRKPNDHELSQEYHGEKGFFDSWHKDLGVQAPSHENFIDSVKEAKVQTIPHKDIKSSFSDFHSSSDEPNVNKLRTAMDQGKDLPMPIAYHVDSPGAGHHGKKLVFGGRSRIGAAHESGRDVQALVLPYPKKLKKSLQPGDSYNDLRKAEDLAKMPGIYDLDGADHIGISGYSKVSKKVHKETLPNGLVHTVKQNPHDSNEYVHLLHHPAKPKNPLAQIHIVKDSHYHDDADEKEPIVSHSVVNPKHKGKGLGKQLYLAAAGYHGQLSSDSNISANAHKAWKKMGRAQGLEVSLGTHAEGYEHEPHKAYAYGDVKTKKNFPKVKLGKSLQPGQSYRDLEND